MGPHRNPAETGASRRRALPISRDGGLRSVGITFLCPMYGDECVDQIPCVHLRHRIFSARRKNCVLKRGKRKKKRKKVMMKKKEEAEKKKKEKKKEKEEKKKKRRRRKRRPKRKKNDEAK